jgi:14-3-3 protein epsilon
MADLWKPVKGVTIKEATQGVFLFHFAHPLDMEAVLNGGPWTFDNNMLILEQVHLGVQIEQIPLFHVTMWVQVHNLPTGLMKATVGEKLANYIGVFVDYDKNNNSSFWRQYMRIRVRIDVRQPLKKDTKVKNREGEWCTVNFKYEKLGIFCFLCGIMGHAENKCELRYAMEQDDGRRDWSVEIRAENRRQGGRIGSRWLREERGGREESGGGGGEAQPSFPVGGPHNNSTNADVASHGPTIFPNSNQHTFKTNQSHLILHDSVQSQVQNGPAINPTSQLSLIANTKEYLFLNQSVASQSDPEHQCSQQQL